MGGKCATGPWVEGCRVDADARHTTRHEQLRRLWAEARKRQLRRLCVKRPVRVLCPAEVGEGALDIPVAPSRVDNQRTGRGQEAMRALVLLNVAHLEIAAREADDAAHAHELREGKTIHRWSRGGEVVGRINVCPAMLRALK